METKFEVYVILSQWSDNSGSPQVVGVYFDKDDAEHLVTLLKNESSDKKFSVVTKEVV